MNYGEYQELPQATCTGNTENFASLRIECVINQSTVVTLNSFRLNNTYKYAG